MSHDSPTFPASGNLFDDGNLLGNQKGHTGERFDTLCNAPGMRLERIVSHGHATPEGEWYDQEMAEWVVVLQGRARLRFEDEAALCDLGPGDFLYIPPHRRHKVTWTDPDAPTVWLALHHDPSL